MRAWYRRRRLRRGRLSITWDHSHSWLKRHSRRAGRGDRRDRCCGGRRDGRRDARRDGLRAGEKGVVATRAISAGDVMPYRGFLCDEGDIAGVLQSAPMPGLRWMSYACALFRRDASAVGDEAEARSLSLLFRYQFEGFGASHAPSQAGGAAGRRAGGFGTAGTPGGAAAALHSGQYSHAYLKKQFGASKRARASLGARRALALGASHARAPTRTPAPASSVSQGCAARSTSRGSARSAGGGR